MGVYIDPLLPVFGRGWLLSIHQGGLARTLVMTFLSLWTRRSNRSGLGREITVVLLIKLLALGLLWLWIVHDHPPPAPDRLTDHFLPPFAAQP